MIEQICWAFGRLQFGVGATLAFGAALCLASSNPWLTPIDPPGRQQLH